MLGINVYIFWAFLYFYSFLAESQRMKQQLQTLEKKINDLKVKYYLRLYFSGRNSIYLVVYNILSSEYAINQILILYICFCTTERGETCHIRCVSERSNGRGDVWNKWFCYSFPFSLCTVWRTWDHIVGLASQCVYSNKWNCHKL